MDLPTLAKIVSDFGYECVAFAFMAFIAWKLLSWGYGLVEKTMNEMAKQREGFQNAILKLDSSMQEHRIKVYELHGRLQEAMKYQRDEHLKQMELANENCTLLKTAVSKLDSEVDSFKEDHKASRMQHERMINCLGELEKGLARINGYKHD